MNIGFKYLISNKSSIGTFSCKSLTASHTNVHITTLNHITNCQSQYFPFYAHHCCMCLRLRPFSKKNICTTLSDSTHLLLFHILTLHLKRKENQRTRLRHSRYSFMYPRWMSVSPQADSQGFSGM